MKLLFTLILASVLCSCAQMDTRKTIFTAVEPIPELRCNPQVYLDKQEAEEKGAIEELCSVTAKVGLTLSDKDAVKSLSPKVCECGANNAYVVRTDKGTFGQKTATMIGFRYKEKASKKKQFTGKLISIEEGLANLAGPFCFWDF